jgi:hypothetical protein
MEEEISKKVPKPKKGETKDKFISRTIEFLVGEGMEQEQASGIAYSQWGKKGKVKKTQYDFIKSIPMDMSLNEIRDALYDAVRIFRNENKNIEWNDIYDIYLDGSCIVHFSYKDDTPGKYFSYDYSFNEKDEAILTNPVEVKLEQSWEEVDKKEFGKEKTIFKVDKAKHLVYGVVLAPNEEDAQGDIINEDEIEKTAHKFMEDYRDQVSEMGIMHKKTTPHVVMVENYVAPSDFELNGETVTKGSWVMVSKVKNKDIWKKVEDGEFTGYSIGGKGKRVPVKQEE